MVQSSIQHGGNAEDNENQWAHKQRVPPNFVMVRSVTMEPHKNTPPHNILNWSNKSMS